MANMSKKPNCEITLDKPNNHIYFPGDIVRGTIQLSKKYWKANLIILSLYGITKVRFTVKSSRHHCQLISEDIKIFQTYRYLSINREQNLYRFLLKIPHENQALPWSVKTPNGEVEYGIKCFLKGSYCSADFEIARKSFSLKSLVNWNTITGVNGDYYNRACHQTCKTLSYNLCNFPIFCENPKVKVSLLEWKWYEPGEQVPFKIEFDNTRVCEYVGKGFVRLVSKWHYTSFNRSNVLNGKKLYSEPKQIWITAITANEKRHVKEFTFLLPNNLMATQAESQVLVLMHKLQVIAELVDQDEIKIPFKAEVDILVGSKCNNNMYLWK